MPSRSHDDDSRLERRRYGRIRCELLECQVGKVVNLGMGGMRVDVKGKFRYQPGDVLEVKLAALERDVDLNVRVVWVQKTGVRRFAVGLEFVDVTPEITKSIQAIARDAAVLRDISE